MDWVKSTLGLSNEPTSISSDNSNLNFTTPEEESSCFSCHHPCELHPNIPSSMAGKINQTKPLLGTVKPYGVQLVLCTGDFDWEPKIEKTDGTFARSLSSELKFRGDQLPARVLLTAGSTHSHSHNSNDMDILVFPSMIRFNSIKMDQVSTWITDGLFAGTSSNTSSNTSSTSSNISSSNISSSIASSNFSSEQLTKRAYILICTHKKRDKRCGVIGPMLVDEFHRSLREHGLDQDVDVIGVSHFGGHKFAGNVILYPGGVWYGRVTACDVDPLIKKHIIDGKIVKKLYRGSISDGSQQETKW